MAHEGHARYPAVVIGGSAGAHEPLLRIIAQLPADLAAYVFIVIHMPSDSVSSLPHILARRGHLFAAHALEGAPLLPGRIIVAPPDFHLTITQDAMHVRTGARENGHRPSIDVLFRSAAAAFGPHTIGVVLSGTLDDGVDGLRAIGNVGGLCFVQDPATATFPGMPSAAIAANVVDTVYGVDDIAPAICAFIAEVGKKAPPSLSVAISPDERSEGQPSIFTCPDCGGTLWELEVADDMRFRCRTGHAYSPASMLSAQNDGIEHALWAAIRSLQERTDLLRKLSQRAVQRREQETARLLDVRVSATKHHIEALQGTLNDMMRRPRQEN